MQPINRISQPLAARLEARPVLGYACAVLVMAAVISFVFLSSSVLIIPNAGVMYLLVVIGSAFWLGLGPAICAAVLSFFAIAFFYIPLDASVPVSTARLAIISTVLIVGVVIARLARREQRRAQLLSRQAQHHADQMSALVESMVDAVYVANPEGRLVGVNKAGVELLGLKSKEDALRPLAEYPALGTYCLPDGRIMPPEEFGLARALRGETFAGYEFGIQMAGGTVRWASASGAPLRDERGEITAAVNVTRDITAQKAGEQELQRLAHHWRLLLESVDEGVYGADIEGCCTFLNRSAAKMLGYEPEELVGKNIHRLIHDRRRDGSEYPAEQCPMVRALRSGQHSRVEDETFWRRDGSSFPIELSSHPIVDRGVIAGAVVTFVDITARKRASEERERLLREAEVQRTLFQTVVDNAPVGVALVRPPSFVHELVNPAFQAMVPGVPLVGRTVGELSPEFRSQVVPLLEQVCLSGKPYFAADRPFTIQRMPDAAFEEAYFTFTYTPLPDKHGQTEAILILASETTPQVRARERDEQAAEERAAWLVRLRALVRVSHQVLAEKTFDGLLQQVADATRELTGARVVAAGHGYTSGKFQIVSASRMEGAAPCPPGKDFAIEKGGVYLDLLEKMPSIRLTDGELRAHPAWWGLPADHCPLRGLLGARMVDTGGQTIGLILATDKESGDFTAENEDVLQQLAGLASLGLQHLEARAAAEGERDRARASAEWLRVAQQAGHSGTFDWDAKQNVNVWSEELLALYGFQPGEFGGRYEDWVECLVLEDREAGAAAVQRSLETGEFAVEFRIRRRDNGEIRWMHGRGQVLFDGDGRPARMIGINVDITERKQGEQALREAKDYAESLIQTSNVMVVGLDVAGNVRVFNEAAEKLTGYTKAELEGQNWFEVLVPKDRYPHVWAVFASAMAGGSLPVAFEYPILTKSGEERHIAWRNSVLRDGGRITGTISFGIDLTEQRELDRLKEQFISIAAHELKTPVTIMKGYAQSLLRSGRTAEQSRTMLEAIDQGSSRIDAVVQDLLDISKLVAGQLDLAVERIDLSALVAQCVDRLALVSDKHNVGLATAAPAVVQGDRDRLEQVIMNLLDNAVKYSPQGAGIEVALAISGGEVVVSFRDHGVGIAREKQGRIFQRFYSAHTGTPHDYGGMAVGLYISKEIVARHGGRMWFESEEGKGSTFYFSLPLTPETK